MARSWITAAEYIVGAGHPVLPDVKNRVGRELWAAFIAEHDASTGQHKSPYDTLLLYETGTYIGTGAAQDVTLAGALAGILLQMVWVWSAAYSSLYLTITGWGGVARSLNEGDAPLAANTLTLGTSTFSLGTAGEVNNSGTTYYYIAYGQGQTADIGDTSSEPSWIDHNVAMLGGISTTMANSAENELDTSFQAEHNEDGTHKTSAFSGVGTLEIGTLNTFEIVSGKYIFNDDITVALSNTSLDVKFLLWANTTQRAGMPYFIDEESGVLRSFGNAALSPGSNSSVATGSFTVSPNQQTEETIFDLQDQANGSTTLTDSSSYAHPLTVGLGTPTWTSATFAEGTTSLNISNASFYAEDAATGLLTFQDRSLRLMADFEINFHVKGGTDSNWIYLVTFGFLRFGQAVNGFATSAARVDLYDWTGTTTTITGSTNIKDNTWHEITIKRIDGNVTLEVDNVPEGSVVENFEAIYFDGIRVGLQVYYQAGAAWYIDRLTVKRKPLVVYPDFYDYIAIGAF